MIGHNSRLLSCHWSIHVYLQDTQADLATIISCCCDPLVAQLQLVAGQLPSCDGAVFLTNNLHQLRTTLSLYPVLPPSSLTSHSLQLVC